MRLSETQRAMMIAWEYGIRLACGNIDQDGLNRLISDYPSHGFIIDRHEASEIFKKVRKPTSNETALRSALIDLGVMDEGMNGQRPMIVALLSEMCTLSADNEWTGIEYDDGNEEKPHVEARKAKRGSGAAARTSNAKPVRRKNGDAATAKQNPDGSDGLPKTLDRA